MDELKERVIKDTETKLVPVIFPGKIVEIGQLLRGHTPAEKTIVDEKDTVEEDCNTMDVGKADDDGDSADQRATGNGQAAAAREQPTITDRVDTLIYQLRGYLTDLSSHARTLSTWLQYLRPSKSHGLCTKAQDAAVNVSATAKEFADRELKQIVEYREKRMRLVAKLDKNRRNASNTSG